MRSSHGGIALLAKASTNRPPRQQGHSGCARTRLAAAARSALGLVTVCMVHEQKKQPPTGHTAWQIWQSQAAVGSLRALRRRISAMHSFRTMTTYVSISSSQQNLMKTYHNEANTSEITKIALKMFLDFFGQSTHKIAKFD